MSKQKDREKREPETILLRLYLLLIVLGVALVSYLGVTQSADIYQSRTFGEVQTISGVESWIDDDATAPVGKVEHYRFRLGTLFTGTDVISFYAPNHYVKVLIDGMEVYHAMPSADAWGWTIGNVWANVAIDQYDSGRVVEVQLTPVLNSAVGDTVNFTVGSYYLILQQQLLQDIPSIILSVISTLVGAVYIGVGLLRGERRGRRFEMVLLGVFAMLFGIWKLTDTPFFAFLTSRAPRVHSYLSLLAFTLLPTPAVLFMGRRLKTANKKLFLVLAAASLVCAAATLLMQLFNIADLRRTIYLSDVLVGFCLLVVAYSVLHELRHGKPNRNARWSMISLVFVYGGIAADIVASLSSGDSNSNILYALAGVVIYILISGIITSADLNRRANVDRQTGLASRGNSFELLDDPTPLEAGVGLIMFDINDLKKTNDTLGHEAGDDLIIRFARAINEKAPEGSFVGRTGGDEFICVIRATNGPALDAVVAEVHSGAKEIGGEPALSFSAGWALSEGGETMRVLFEKADSQMYEEKRAYHQGEHDRRGASRTHLS